MSVFDSDKFKAGLMPLSRFIMDILRRIQGYAPIPLKHTSYDNPENSLPRQTDKKNQCNQVILKISGSDRKGLRPYSMEMHLLRQYYKSRNPENQDSGNNGTALFSSFLFSPTQ